MTLTKNVRLLSPGMSLCVVWLIRLTFHKNLLPLSPGMEAAASSEMLVYIYHTTGYHIQEDHILHQLQSESVIA